MGSEPRGLRYYIEFGPVHVVHLVLRGAYLPGTVRCVNDGVRFRYPPYAASTSLAGFTHTAWIKCYADVRGERLRFGLRPAHPDCPDV